MHLALENGQALVVHQGAKSHLTNLCTFEEANALNSSVFSVHSRANRYNAVSGLVP